MTSLDKPIIQRIKNNRGFNLEFKDSLFLLRLLTEVDSGPYSGCRLPFKFPHESGPQTPSSFILLLLLHLLLPPLSSSLSLPWSHITSSLCEGPGVQTVAQVAGNFPPDRF